MDDLKVGDRVVTKGSDARVGTVLQADNGDPVVRVAFFPGETGGWWKRTSLRKVEEGTS